MIERLIGQDCTGCTACESICPRKSIRMEKNREGFYYPLVDEQTCIHCFQCVQTCPVLQEGSVDYRLPEVYAAWNKNENIRLSSTSGGVFSALAEAVFKKGGFVVGAVYEQDHSIRHIITDRVEDLPRLRQSKYAQSILSGVFPEIKQRLLDGKIVLFCGTPCQSAGLQKYLGNGFEKLYCCDFICRGVISQTVYHKYLKDLAIEKGTEVVSIQFKNKDLGWNQFTTKIWMGNGEIYQKDRNNDPYMRGYLQHNLYLRPSCYACHFKRIPRISDLSLGDFWGIESYDESIDSRNGISAIMVNSDKGYDLFSWALLNLDVEKRAVGDVAKGNICLLHSVAPGKYREYFFRNMERYPFNNLIERIDKKSSRSNVKNKVNRLLNWLKSTDQR